MSSTDRIDEQAVWQEYSPRVLDEDNNDVDCPDAGDTSVINSIISLADNEISIDSDATENNEPDEIAGLLAENQKLASVVESLKQENSLLSEQIATVTDQIIEKISQEKNLFVSNLQAEVRKCIQHISTTIINTELRVNPEKLNSIVSLALKSLLPNEIQPTLFLNEKSFSYLNELIASNDKLHISIDNNLGNFDFMILHGSSRIGAKIYQLIDNAVDQIYDI